MSDGYHTITDLYEHRFALYLALAREMARNPQHQHLPVWRSLLHSDGTSFPGWFVLGIGTEAGQQITYHLPLSQWDQTEFAETHDRAPAFDGHSSKDVLIRLAVL